MPNLVAAGSVNAQNQVVLDMDVVRAALMAQPQGQGGGGGVDVLAALGDGMQLVASGIRIERLRGLEARVSAKRAAVQAAQTVSTAAIANALGVSLPAGSVPDPTDPTGAIILALQALQVTSQAQQDLAQSQQLLDQCQDEEAAWTAGSAAVKLVDDLGAGSGGGMGGMGGGGGVGTAALVGGLAGGAAGLLTSGSRGRRGR